MEQQTRKLRLICNSIKALDAVTLSVNDASDKSSAPKAMKFGSWLAQRFQRVWEDDTKEVPIWLSKWYISDDFHWCNLQPEDVGKFAYVRGSIPDNVKFSYSILSSQIFPTIWNYA